MNMRVHFHHLFQRQLSPLKDPPQLFIMSSKRDRAKFWIAKVPEYLLTSWENAANGTTVATLHVPERKHTDPPLKKCKIVTHGTDDVPKEFELVVRKEYVESPSSSQKNPDQILIFSESSKDGNKIEGKIDIFADITTDTNSEEYKRMLRNKIAASKKREKVTQVLIENPSIDYTLDMNRGSALRNDVSNTQFKACLICFQKKKEPKHYDSFLKRARMEPEELKQVLLDLFRRQEYWKFKDISDETEQPDVNSLY